LIKKITIGSCVERAEIVLKELIQADFAMNSSSFVVQRRLTLMVKADSIFSLMTLEKCFHLLGVIFLFAVHQLFFLIL
jgi:hypothetical protein